MYVLVFLLRLLVFFFKWVQKIGSFYLTYYECEQWKVRKSLRNNPQSEINEENKPKLQKTANKNYVHLRNQLLYNFPSAGSLRSQAGG